MSPRNFIAFAVFLGILLLVDIYAYKGVQTALATWSAAGRRWVRILYWVVSIGMLLTWIVVAVGIQELRQSRNYSFMFSLAAVFMLFLLPKLVVVAFHLVEDVVNGFRWLWCKLAPGAETIGDSSMTRLRFLSQVGLAVATIPFVGVLYGITKGRRNFRVVHQVITSKKLPPAFNGLRVVQISDMHLGSFPLSSSIVQHGVELILSERPDLILFTGDLVNDFSEEAEPWLDVLKQLQAPLGKYSVLGNHDYSDYAQWPRVEEKQANLQRLLQHHRTIGFRLLLDEHVPIEKDGATFSLIGVQNWGSRFQQYGDLKKALAGTRPEDFRLLMSHDPSHWEAQVWQENVDLTLSGHTHGAQFGITIAGQTYSPAQWVYKHWAGLYTHGSMHLYVNRGFGFIGFPGRVGMPPEITVLELRTA
jgi:uncharacterized protein